MLHIPSLYIAPSQTKGRGMFTANTIQINDIIEVCPVIPVPKDEIAKLDTTVLHDYYFLWQENMACIALGYGCLYNHSKQPNAEIIADYPNQSLVVKCISPIEAGEEIFINYQGNGIHKPTLWFTPSA